MTRRTERVGSLIRDTIGQLLLSKVSDPRIDPARASVTRVEVTDDLLTAKVFVSVMGSEGQQRRTLRGLRRASGRVQEVMMRRIKLRHTPVLEFVLDNEFKNTLETLRIIDQAMAEIRHKEDAEPEETTEPPDTTLGSSSGRQDPEERPPLAGTCDHETCQEI